MDDVSQAAGCPLSELGQMDTSAFAEFGDGWRPSPPGSFVGGLKVSVGETIMPCVLAKVLTLMLIRAFAVPQLWRCQLRISGCPGMRLWFSYRAMNFDQACRWPVPSR